MGYSSGMRAALNVARAGHGRTVTDRSRRTDPQSRSARERHRRTAPARAGRRRPLGLAVEPPHGRGRERGATGSSCSSTGRVRHIGPIDDGDFQRSARDLLEILEREVERIVSIPSVGEVTGPRRGRADPRHFARPDRRDRTTRLLGRDLVPVRAARPRVLDRGQRRRRTSSSARSSIPLICTATRAATSNSCSSDCCSARSPASGLGAFTETIQAEQTSGTLEVLLATPTALPTLFVGSLDRPAGFRTDRDRLRVRDLDHRAGRRLPGQGMLTAALAMPPTLALFAAIGAISAAFIVLSKRGDPFTPVVTQTTNFLAGALFPIAVLPGVLQGVAHVLPPFYALAGPARGSDQRPVDHRCRWRLRDPRCLRRGLAADIADGTEEGPAGRPRHGDARVLLTMTRRLRNHEFGEIARIDPRRCTLLGTPYECSRRDQ